MIIQYHIISYHITYVYIYIYIHIISISIYIYIYTYIIFELQTLGHVRVSLAVPMCRWSVVRLGLPPGGSPCLCQEITEKTMDFSGNCLIFNSHQHLFISFHICFFLPKRCHLWDEPIVLEDFEEICQRYGNFGSSQSAVS